MLADHGKFQGFLLTLRIPVYTMLFVDFKDTRVYNDTSIKLQMETIRF